LRALVIDALSEERRVKGEESVSRFTFHSSPFTVEAELRAVAEHLLAESLSARPTREAALTLLAADALITLAVEAEAAFEIRNPN
jgi:hypothetical protein